MATSTYKRDDHYPICTKLHYWCQLVFVWPYYACSQDYMEFSRQFFSCFISHGCLKKKCIYAHSHSISISIPSPLLILLQGCYFTFLYTYTFNYNNNDIVVILFVLTLPLLTTFIFCSVSYFCHIGQTLAHCISCVTLKPRLKHLSVYLSYTIYCAHCCTVYACINEMPHSPPPGSRWGLVRLLTISLGRRGGALVYFFRL